MINQRISDALYLLSRDNYWDSIKIVYDVLINETFQFAKRKSKIKQHEIEEKGITMLMALHQLLVEKRVHNFYPILSEIRLLTIFFNNYSRETLKSTSNNQKIKVLTLNLIGLLNHLSDPSNALYTFGGIQSELKDEIENNLTEEIFNSTSYYFDILFDIETDFDDNFWEKLSTFDPSINNLSLFSYDEYNYLFQYKGLIDEKELNIDKDNRDIIEEIWGTQLDYDEITLKIKNQYYLQILHRELDTFRRVDKSSSKYDKNIYRKEKEGAFHKNIYPFFTQSKEDYDLVISEYVSGKHRHDIILNKLSNSFSAIIELKVNDLKKANDNLIQLIDYLSDASDKSHHYIETPKLGSLVTYYIGDKELKDIDLTADITVTEVSKISNNFYLAYSDETNNYPILITILNGKD